MANDGSLTSRIEAWIVTILTALTHNNEVVFKTVDVWMGQIGATKSGLEAFDRFAPFAFVGYQPDYYSAREGDYDLRKPLEFAITIGVTSKSNGVARKGDTNNIGANLIEELVIAALDKQHPGNGFDCDDLYHIGTMTTVDALKKRGIQINFTADRVSNE